MVYVSQNDLNNCIKNNLYKIPTEVDLIVANPRSGINPAIIISLLKNLPICDISVFESNKIYSCGTTKQTNFIKTIDEAKKILIVEDSSYTGKSLEKIKEKIPSKYIKKCVILTIFVNEKTKNLTDIYFQEINHNRIFEWNLFHHKYLNYAGVELNVIYNNNRLVLKPTQFIKTIIINDDMNKKNAKNILKDIKYGNIIYKNEITDEAFIVCKDKTKYNNDVLKIEF